MIYETDTKFNLSQFQIFADKKQHPSYQSIISRTNRRLTEGRDKNIFGEIVTLQVEIPGASFVPLLVAAMFLVL